SQKAWITVTPVNDPPSMANSPDLFVHYDSPYNFDYTPYISDPDDPLFMLTLTSDKPAFVTVSGLVLTYNYPISMSGR
ncbi:unnamed protein product, partial [marine sediment metagenome]